MKPFLFLASQTKQFKRFREETEKFGVKIYFASWSDILIRRGQPKKVFLSTNGKEVDLREFSLIFIRTVGSNCEKLYLLSDYIGREVPVVDQDLSLHGRRDSKAFQYRRMANNGLPVIPYAYGSFDSLLAHSEDFKFPLVLKRAQGNQGKNVWLINNKDQLEKAKQDLGEDEQKGLYYLVQDYIENNGDYRLFIIGDRCLGAIKRVGQEDEFRNNVSLGGKATTASVSQEIIDLAISAARVCQIDIAGVDIIFDKSGAPFVLEVNSSPQFGGFEKATGINVAKEIITFLIDKAKE